MSLCFECHNIAEIYHLKTRADIIGSFPVPPPELQEWIAMKEQVKVDEYSDTTNNQPVYGIVYLDHHHCLRCGFSIPTRRVRMEYEQDGIKVVGFCFLCQKCAQVVAGKEIKTIPYIIGSAGMIEMKKESSCRFEVFNRAFYEAFRQPNWIKGKFAGKPNSSGSRKGLAP